MRLERDEDGTRMVCKGEFNEAHAVAIQQFLEQSATRTGNETLVLTDVTTIDVIGIKLVYAWRSTLELQSRKAHILLPVSEAIQQLLEKTGIAKLLQSR